MSVSGPFVNRTSELNRMRNGLRPESDAQMYTVSGPKGFGKSTLLEKFATECESDETPVIWYDFNEPETVQIFLQRFLKEWEKKISRISCKSGKRRDFATNNKIINGGISSYRPIWRYWKYCSGWDFSKNIQHRGRYYNHD